MNNSRKNTSTGFLPTLNSQQKVEMPVIVPEQILFIGFGNVIGHRSISWEDRDWPNAADFDCLFINEGELYFLFENWAEMNENGISVDLSVVDLLVHNLQTLRGEVVQLINSDREVFAFTTPEKTFLVGHRENSQSGIYITPMMWSPLPISTELAKPGERLVCNDERFSGYARQIREWRFSFDMKVRDISRYDVGKGNDNLLCGTNPEVIIRNLSNHALGVKLTYISLREKRGQYEIVDTSGPIYLLHYPIKGDVQQALRELLRGYYGIQLVESKEPEWVSSILPPNGGRIDMALEDISIKMDMLEEQRSALLEERKGFEKWRQLIYESGDVLEVIVREALILLGMENVKSGPKGEWDIEGTVDGNVYIFEVKGVHGNPGRGYVLDLGRHIVEFEGKNPEIAVKKGVVVANSERINQLATRNRTNEGFNGDAVALAKKLDYALLNTWTLYQIVSEVLEGKRADGKDFLLKLGHTVGVYNLT